MPYHPLQEGVDHINMYSNSRLDVGRALSNFAGGNIRTRHGMFRSVEGYWFWLSTGMVDDKLRDLQGYAAKQHGEKLNRVFLEDFDIYIKEAIAYKMLVSPLIVKGLREYPDLPIVHYYYYGKPDNCKVVEIEDHAWMVEWMNTIAKVIRKTGPIRFLIAGSRDLECRLFINGLLKRMAGSGMFEDLILVNGLARGIDRVAKEEAEELAIEVEPYPADWERHGRAAGMIRNRQMGDVADIGLALWDGVSPGTLGMVEYMRHLNKPMMVITGVK